MSVCVVHRNGWAVTDSRHNFGNVGVLPTKAKKAFLSQGSLVTVVGDAILAQKLEFHSQNKTIYELPAAIAELIFDNYESIDAHVLMVNKKRQLLHIDGKGFICPMEEVDFWAIGCAADKVLGYLDHCVVAGRVIDPSVVEEAIKRAARYDSGIDDRCQTLYLGQ